MISKAIDFLNLIRFENILIIAFTQSFAYYFLSNNISLVDILNQQLIFLIVATILVASAAYIINDYFDLKLDKINKASAVIVGNGISSRMALFAYWIINIAALCFAYLISFRVFLMVFICQLFLWFYSQYFKKMFLIGNIVVSFMASASILILFVFDSNVSKIGLIVYAIFSFVTTLIREIIKDTEDIRGDEKFDCCTLPIVLGIQKTKNILIALQVFFIIIVAGFLLLTNSLIHSQNVFYCCLYVILFVQFPNLIMLYLIYKSDAKKDFTRLSFISKFSMLFGIISMVFWKI